MNDGKRARAPRTGHDLLALVASHARALRVRCQAACKALAGWRWTPLFARCVLGALGLALLAGIGRSALAGGALSSSSSAPAAVAPSSAASPPRLAAAVLVPVATASASTSVASASASAAPAEAAGASQGRPSSRATPEDPVILNQAAFEDLRRLPGVGPKRAQAILALRQRLGRFRQVEDLLKVKGIGRSTLRKLRPLIKLDPVTS